MIPVVLVHDFLHILQGKKWDEIIYHLSLTQRVNVPTRVTENTSSIIDHIYTTNVKNISNIEVSCIGLNGHYPVYCEWHF